MNVTTVVPPGCASSMDPLYYPLCDLHVMWGIVVEAFAGAGIVTALVLLIVTTATLPFIEDRSHKGMLSLQVNFLVFTLGLFGMSIVFIMGRSRVTCMIRLFSFGVLFAGCFACLVMHGFWLVLLDREQSPQAWMLQLGMAALWLVEVIINMEWLIILDTQRNNTATIEPHICSIPNKDFTGALTYVMALLVAVVLMAVPSLTHKYKPFRRDGLFILLSGILSMCLWLTWVVMYVYGNEIQKHQNWNDATLAIAMVSNGWVFLMVYSIPEICALTKPTDADDDQSDEGERSSLRSRVYENILRDQQGKDSENKDTSMDNPQKENTAISPYSGYSGPQRGRVYQPTELALISGNINKEMYSEGLGSRATPLPLIPGGGGGGGGGDGGGGSNGNWLPREG